MPSVGSHSLENEGVILIEITSSFLTNVRSIETTKTKQFGFFASSMKDIVIIL